MGLSNKLSRESGSFSCHLNPHRFFQSEALRIYFPALQPWVAQTDSLPSCSSQFICTQMWPGLPAAVLPRGLSAQLPISTPPTGLDECVFFNSLAVRLLHSSFFCQFFFVLFLNCCCPSFGCARRHSVSTYTSILARSLPGFLPTPHKTKTAS